MEKLKFAGKIISIQPRIRLNRSFDESSHSYLGFAMKLDGEINNTDQDSFGKTIFSVGIGKAAHAKHQLKVNDIISGECLPVSDPVLEPVDYYKVSKLKLIKQSVSIASQAGPWEQDPLELEVYRARGRRRLAAKTYEAFCSSFNNYPIYYPERTKNF